MSEADIAALARGLGENVRTLPYAAQIGMLIACTLAAVGCGALGFIRLFQDRSNPAKALGYFLLGIVLFGAATVSAW